MTTDAAVAAGAVVIVSRRILLRRALLAANGPADRSVVELDGGARLHDVLTSSAPAVVVLDAVHPWRSGCCADPLDCATLIRRRSPRTRVLLLADEPRPEDLVAHALAGVAGVFDTGSPLHRFGDAVDAVARGEAWYTRRAIGELVDRLSRGGAGPDSDAARTDAACALTDREVEILGLLARGYGHQRISRELGVSPHTARTHVRNILGKLNVHSRADAVRFAIRAGYVEQPRG